MLPDALAFACGAKPLSGAVPRQEASPGYLDLPLPPMGLACDSSACHLSERLRVGETPADRQQVCRQLLMQPLT